MISEVWFLKYVNSSGIGKFVSPFIFHQLLNNLSMSEYVHCIHGYIWAIVLLKITLCCSVFNSLKQEIGWFPIGKNIYFYIYMDHFCPLPCLLQFFTCVYCVKEWITNFTPANKQNTKNRVCWNIIVNWELTFGWILPLLHWLPLAINALDPQKLML